MAPPEFRQAEGRWRVWAASPELVAPALAIARARHDTHTVASAQVELAGLRAWCTSEAGEGLRGRARAHAAGYTRLEWLRARAFLAPRPLAAGYRMRRLRSLGGFLVCERVEGAQGLRAFLERRDDPLRAAVLEELARELARLHTLHGSERGVLVQREGRAGRVHFTGTGARLPLEEGASGLLEAGERERFLACYAHERRAQQA
ncbi:MAG: hypothetical protein IPJ19_20000 [Planctomycetes bacterium]|nr:hypothetical protein [Planctomycetota bacterium]